MHLKEEKEIAPLKVQLCAHLLGSMFCYLHGTYLNRDGKDHVVRVVGELQV